MKGLYQQLAISLTLYFRNRMAMLYGYLFPSVFLLAFWVLYRYERVPLVRHMGELLTVTILGGACFGLATTLVSERERGVWRRFKLAPIATGSLVVSTLVARYLLLITAGLLQLVLAMALGMPWPEHPFDLLLAFTAASFAFLGLGLVIAMLANNVPAVQALGQVIFLPMLIIGGVAVPLTALPDWALHLSAFFPGRYAVEAIQACVAGEGLGSVGFSMLALLLIGAAACVAGSGMFRWDAQQRFSTVRGKSWVAVALAGWIGAGLLAEVQDKIGITPDQAAGARAQSAPAATAGPGGSLAEAPTSAPRAPAEQAEPSGSTPPATAAGEMPPAATDPAASSLDAPPPVPGPTEAAPLPAEPSAAPVPQSAREEAPTGVPGAASANVPPWKAVMLATIKEELVFTRLPPDAGVVTPIASIVQEPDPDVAAELDIMYGELQAWPPGLVPDLLQRARNLLFVAAVVDVFQEPTEAFVPLLVFEKLERDIPRDDLLKVLYWIAVHPDEGSDAAVDQMQALGLRNGPSDMTEVRGRAGVYAVKLIGRLTGDRPGN